jgi:hypothetical protein
LAWVIRIGQRQQRGIGLHEQVEVSGQEGISK